MKGKKEGGEIKGREGRKRGKGEKERGEKKKEREKKKQSSTAGLEPATFHSAAWRVDSHVRTIIDLIDYVTGIGNAP